MASSDQTAGWIERAPWRAYAALAVFYLLLKAPALLAIDAFENIIIPLDALYMAQKLLFSGAGLRPEVADSVPALSNAAFVYPPGVYALIHWLGLTSVRGLFALLLAAQLGVPLLAYRLLAEVLDRRTAFLAAAFAAAYLVRVDWFTPDFLIQPLLLASLWVLRPGRRGSLAPVDWAGLGALTGTVMVLKHNVGLFHIGLCGTALMFRCLKSDAPSGRPRALLYFLLACHALFAVVFARQTGHLDTALYFLAPYAAFWAVFAGVLRRDCAIGLDDGDFLRRAATYVGAAALLPAGTFLWVGGAMGYADYWHSLFGIGYEHGDLWDKGIAGVMRNYVLPVPHPVALFHSALWALLFLLPFGVNVLSAGLLWARRADPAARSSADWEVAAIGVTGAFMLFPLEGLHILLSKTLVSAFVLAWWARGPLTRLLRPARAGLAALVTAAVFLAGGRAARTLRAPRAQGGAEVRAAVGMPLRAELARELDAQVAVLKGSVGGAPYYVVDSSGETLTGLAWVVDNGVPQYYIEMRRGALGPRDTAAVLSDLGRVDFVVVNAGDRAAFAAGARDDVRFAEVMATVESDFAPVAGYTPPPQRSPALGQVTGFVVMRRKGRA